MNSKQIRILAEAYAERMIVTLDDITVHGTTKEVWINQMIRDAELIRQPDGSLSIVGDGITVLIRTTDPIDEPTIERIGSATPSGDYR